MARPRQFKISALADLFRQIRYAPAEARMRQMNAAEQLAREIDPERNYPEEFIIYRITGYRPDSDAATGVVVGGALLGELVTFVQRLSSTLALRIKDIDRTPIELDDLAAKLQITTRTIQRYRRLGLVCHEVVNEAGVHRLICFADALEHFRTQHAAQLSDAAAFTRVDDSAEQSIIEQARTLRRAQGLTLHKAAEHLAEQHDRARETVRGILQRYDRRSRDPIFTERGPLTEQEQRVIARAHSWGVEPAQLAARFGRSRKTIYRVLLQQEMRYLRSLPLDAIQLSTFELADADEVLLSPACVREELREPPGCRDAIRFAELIKAAPQFTRHDEQALLGAYNFLKHRAMLDIEALRSDLAADLIDTIQTHLRWATLLKRRLVFLSMPAAITTIERNLTRPLMQQSANEICRFVPLASEIVSDAIEAIDVGRNQELARVITFAMDKRLARLRFAASERRAAARHAVDTVQISDPLSHCTPWHRRLDLDESLAQRVHRLQDADESLIIQRYGLDGSPPRSCLQLAQSLKSTAVGVRRRLRRSLLELRDIARRPT